MTTNQRTAQYLRELGALLELNGASRSRNRILREAASKIEAAEATIGVDDIRDESLKLGEEPASILAEYLGTGTTELFESQRSNYPAGLLDVVQVPGIGATRARSLFETLNVTDLASLIAAAEDGKLPTIKGIGAKSALKILDAAKDYSAQKETSKPPEDPAAAADTASLGEDDSVVDAGNEVAPALEEHVDEEVVGGPSLDQTRDDRGDRIRDDLRNVVDGPDSTKAKRREPSPSPSPLHGLLRCNACHQQGLDDEGYVVECRNCGRRYPVEDHVIDMLELSTSGQSIANNVMEVEAFANAYENIYLPLFTRLTSGYGPEDTYAFSIDLLELRAGLSVIDVGCGPGHFTRRFADATRGGAALTLGVDVSATMLNQARREQFRPAGDGLHYMRANPVRIPLADETMDRAHSAFALNMIPDPHTALREMIRLVKPGGLIVVTVLDRGVALRKRIPRPKGAMWLLAAPALPFLATAATGAAIADIASDAAFSTMGLRFFEAGEVAGVLEGYGAKVITEEGRGRLTIIKARKNP